MKNERYDLDWLLSPYSKTDFISNYWESNVLVVNRENENYYEDVLTLQQIDEALCSLNFELGRIRIEKFQEKVDQYDYLIDDKVADVSKVLNLFKNGHTIILNRLHQRLKSLALLTTSLEHEVSMPFQTNIYLTPENSQGFGKHYDSHCVFILQVSGSKKWRIYEREVLHPSHVYEPEIDRNEEKTITKEFTLHPGDIAYIPRGYVHDASTYKGGGASLHITLGVMTYNWADFLGNFLTVSMMNNPILRQSIPVGFAKPDFDSEKLFGEMQRVLELTKWGDMKEKSLTSFIEHFFSSRQDLRHGTLEKLTKSQFINPTAKLSKRPLAQYQIVESLDNFQIKGKSNQSIFPSNFKEVIVFALNSEDFTVMDLPGNIDVETKIRITQKLIDDSWVMINSVD